MQSNSYVIDLAKFAVISTGILSMFTVDITFAQSPDADHRNQQPPSNSQNLIPQSAPESPPDLGRPPRTIHRVGTAISTPRNSISIKSTDAGTIPRQPPTSGCINCGIVDFVNKMGQGNNLNAIASGIVAGTIAREIIRPHGTNQPDIAGGMLGDHGSNMANPVNPYQIGVTMSDGRQAIIALPDAANFQQGDRVKLIDGALVLDR